MSDESKKKAGLLDKKVKAFFVLRNCAAIIWWLWTTNPFAAWLRADDAQSLCDKDQMIIQFKICRVSHYEIMKNSGEK